jgi:F-type H+-transporting ATPase subunit delta
MRDNTIARNYAEALLSLARAANDTAGYGRALDELVTGIAQDRTLKLFLESPRTSAAQKNEVLLASFRDRMPVSFLRFLQAMVTNRRQGLFGAVAQEYQTLLDVAEGRMHASVTVARPATDEERDAIGRQLSRAFGATVVPHVTVNPAIMGGVVVRVGDTVLDGSVRRRLATVRARMLTGRQ